MSDLSPLSGIERKSNFGAVRSVDDRPDSDIRSQRQSRLFALSHSLPRHKVLGSRGDEAFPPGAQ
jgi:hypothetical protein